MGKKVETVKEEEDEEEFKNVCSPSYSSFHNPHLTASASSSTFNHFDNFDSEALGGGATAFNFQGVGGLGLMVDEVDKSLAKIVSAQ